jgi:large subunit ribosomal protein L29
MQAKELRALTVEQLATREGEMRENLARLSMKRYARRLDRTSDLEAAKRDLARLLTVLTEKRRASTGDGGAARRSQGGRRG